MSNELSKERAIEALYTIRAYYASLTARYPKGKDCKGIGDVMCSEIANSCLMAIKALKQQNFEGKTNGDVIRALFPNIEVKEKNNGYEVYFGVGTAIQFFNYQWWNLPYKESDSK